MSTLTVHQSTTTQLRRHAGRWRNATTGPIVQWWNVDAQQRRHLFRRNDDRRRCTSSLGNAASVGIGRVDDKSGGILDLNVNSIAVAALSGTAGTITDNGATAGTSTLTVNQSTTTSYAGTLADGATRHLALSFSGGTLDQLGNADTYSGGTTINARHADANARPRWYRRAIDVRRHALISTPILISLAGLSGTGGLDHG